MMHAACCTSHPSNFKSFKHCTAGFSEHAQCEAVTQQPLVQQQQGFAYMHNACSFPAAASPCPALLQAQLLKVHEGLRYVWVSSRDRSNLQASSLHP
jgi:hypothetical protein